MFTYIYQLCFGKTPNPNNKTINSFNIDIKDNNLIISQSTNTTSIPIDINYNQITKFFPNNELIKKYDLYSSQIGKTQKCTNELINLQKRREVITTSIKKDDDILSVYEKHINNQNKLNLKEIEILIVTNQKLLDDINSIENTIEIEYLEYINNINKLIIDNDLERYITSDNLKSTVNFYSWIRVNFTKLYIYNSIPETTHLVNAITNMNKTIDIVNIITFEKQMIHENQINYKQMHQRNQLNYNL
jgi:hypothetical protein